VKACAKWAASLLLVPAFAWVWWKRKED